MSGRIAARAVMRAQSWVRSINHGGWWAASRCTLRRTNAARISFRFSRHLQSPHGCARQSAASPSAQALRDSAAEGNKERLQTLLAPLHDASGTSALLREMIESRRIFQPLAWTPEEACSSSRRSQLEDSGLIIRVPDWWSGGRSAVRPAVTVTVEAVEQRKGMCTDALMSFSVEVAMGGEKLTRRTRPHSCQRGSADFAQRPVGGDRSRQTPRSSRQMASGCRRDMNGIPFHIGLRLLAGIGGTAGEADELNAAASGPPSPPGGNSMTSSPNSAIRRDS